MALRRRDFLLAVAGAASFAAGRPSARAGRLRLPWSAPSRIQEPAAEPEWRVGLASIDITPPAGLWMAGYAARKEPAGGAAQNLHAKALALEDAGGRRAVVVALDLLGLTSPIVDRIAADVRRSYGLPREGLLLCCSHTHAGPVIDDQLEVAYDLTPAQWEAVADCTRRIEGQVVAVVGQAINALEPARLRSAQGVAPFAANRRVAFDPHGPTDPAVPVLSVERPDGSLVGVVFLYACHNTTLPAAFVLYHGDYAGVAQMELERRHPGAVALYLAGCGADANPAPRGTIELAEQHGRSLADAVDRALGERTEVRGPLRTAFTTVSLPYAPSPDADAWRRRLEDENVYVRRHAKLMLDTITREGRTRAVEEAPLHVVRIGALALVAIGGEVVVDYALAIKKKFGETVWVAGCTDAVFGYLPSLRVLREGGYEGGEAMLYYGRPGPFDDTVEQRVMSAIDRLMAATS